MQNNLKLSLFVKVSSFLSNNFFIFYDITYSVLVVFGLCWIFIAASKLSSCSECGQLCYSGPGFSLW